MSGIPIEYVEGPDEVTVWLWPNEPDPLSAQIERATWDDLKEQTDGDVTEHVADLILDDLE